MIHKKIPVCYLTVYEVRRLHPKEEGSVDEPGGYRADLRLPNGTLYEGIIITNNDKTKAIKDAIQDVIDECEEIHSRESED